MLIALYPLHLLLKGAAAALVVNMYTTGKFADELFVKGCHLSQNLPSSHTYVLMLTTLSAQLSLMFSLFHSLQLVIKNEFCNLTF